MSEKILHDLLYLFELKVRYDHQIDGAVSNLIIKTNLNLFGCYQQRDYNRKEIANMLGTTPNTVRVMLFAMRKQKRKGKKVTVKEQPPNSCP